MRIQARRGKSMGLLSVASGALLFPAAVMAQDVASEDDRKERRSKEVIIVTARSLDRGDEAAPLPEDLTAGGCLEACSRCWLFRISS